MNNEDINKDQGQGGIDQETARRNRENETGQQSDTQTTDQSKSDQGSSGGDSGSGFVGSGDDQSSDYLTKGEDQQDFAPEGQGADQTSAGTADIETGQSDNTDATLDDGADTSR